MCPDPDGGDRINSYALVSYLPPKLGAFVDQLRRELVPHCALRAHVTLLPPRRICVHPDTAWEEIRAVSAGVKPFTVQIGGVEIFRSTDVIYLELGDGRESLAILHAALNRGLLAQEENWPYHPHITLAQNLREPEQVDELSAVAQRRWEEFDGAREFRVEAVTFVQETRWHGWIDLFETELGSRAGAPALRE